MRSERFNCACKTLYVMLLYGRWYEARQIVNHEIDWDRDPAPPGMTWAAIERALWRMGQLPAY